MSIMDELVTWLRAQLDEDERVAQAAMYWTWQPERAQEFVSAEHIARWDPARVLAEVDAKRQLLDDLSRELGDDDTNETARWYVQLLALPMAGRDGYQESWRP